MNKWTQLKKGIGFKIYICLFIYLFKKSSSDLGVGGCGHIIFLAIAAYHGHCLMTWGQKGRTWGHPESQQWVWNQVAGCDP